MPKAVKPMCLASIDQSEGQWSFFAFFFKQVALSTPKEDDKESCGYEKRWRGRKKRIGDLFSYFFLTPPLHWRPTPHSSAKAKRFCDCPSAHGAVAAPQTMMPQCQPPNKPSTRCPFRASSPLLQCFSFLTVFPQLPR